MLQQPPDTEPDDFGDLDAVALRAYTHLLKNGPAPTAALATVLGMAESETQRFVTELVRHCLVVEERVAEGQHDIGAHADEEHAGKEHAHEEHADEEHRGAPVRWRAVSPYTAVAELVGPEEYVLRHRLESIERTRARLSTLIPLYEEARRRSADSGAIEVVEARSRVMLLISDAAARCSEEALTVQPGGGRPAGHLERALPRDLEMLGRGVRLRTLYQHTARYSPGTQEYVREVSAAGGEVRTLSELFGKMLVFDRSTAFLPVWDNPDAAVVLREPSAVAFLRSVFATAWGLAEPFSASYTAATTTQLRDTIAGQLAEGAKDEVIARKLGMSLRTCRRHIAELMEELGADSRFQAGYLLGLRTQDTPRPGAEAGGGRRD
ncbi:hypothetical protein [Streptomyces sp. NPDC093109]|uniref:hypothetical protein n=1 Tax=Streptomyces sp. NPDC093109 TaxID=3154977 RepID=UPI00344BC13D